MEYLLLAKQYYKNREEYDRLYHSRITSADSTYRLPLSVAGSPAFIVASTEVLSLVENIYLRNNTLTRLFDGLPTDAITALIQRLAVEEMVLSNDIEGVHSSKKELRAALRAVDDAPRMRRFVGMIHHYSRLFTASPPLAASKDIRALYNDTLLPEIDKKHWPDGKLLRKHAVSVYSPVDKELHQGLTPEKKLITFLDAALAWLADNAGPPQIIRVAAFHYLFGYAHPFYDGNGRLGRYISSVLLKDSLNVLVSLKLSHAISSHKTAYGKAFDTCNDPKNKGDLTPFVIFFLSLVDESAEALVTELIESGNRLVRYQTAIEKHCAQFAQPVRGLLLAVVQNSLFSDEAVDMPALIQATGKSDPWVRKSLALLEAEQLITTARRGHSKVYEANFATLDELS